jgi:hypothetical protein
MFLAALRFFQAMRLAPISQAAYLVTSINLASITVRFHGITPGTHQHQAQHFN